MPIRLPEHWDRLPENQTAWTNQLGNLKQSLIDLKAATGSTFLKPAVFVLKLLTRLTQGATKAVQSLTAENGLLTRATERYHALVKLLQPAIDRMTSVMSRGFTKGVEVTKEIVERLGGIDNVMQILAITAAAFFLVMNWSKIITGAKMFMQLIAGIGKIFSLANLKILAIVGAIVVLTLIDADFIYFLLGNDSVIGTFFDKAGIGADNARQAVFDAFGKIKEFLIPVWDAIFEALSAVWNALYETGRVVFYGISKVIEVVFGWIQIFWNSWGSQILAWFNVLWGSLGGILNGFLEIIKGVANFIASVFTGDWQGAWEAIKQIFLAVLAVIVNFAAAVWETIKLLFSMGLSAISAVWNSVWGAISSFFMGIWNGIVSFLDGIWNNIVAGVTGAVSTVKTTIVEGLTAAINWIKSLPESAVKWGSDIIDGIVKGIKGAIGKVGDAVKGIAEKITSFLHFSVPDEGPLTDYESWMPDFMQGLAKGIGDNDYLVLDKVRNMAGDIAMLIKSATANVRTAAAGAVNNVRSSVTQNVNIDNTYNGGGVEAQKNVSRAMKKSATDATTEMARALEYARG